MTPSLSNPKSGELKTLQIAAPFQGVRRQGPLHAPEGVLWKADRTMLEAGGIRCLPAFDATDVLTTTRVPWAVADEEIEGFIPGVSGGAYMVVTDEAIRQHPFTATYEGNVSMRDLSGTWTGVVATNIITQVAGSPEPVEIGAFGSKVSPDSGTTWYTILSTQDDGFGNCQINTIEAINPGFVGQAMEMVYRDLTGYQSLWYGPRYCYFGNSLIYCGFLATYQRALSQGPFSVLTGIYRGRDVINFAGRPILIGAVEAATRFAQTPIAGLDSNLLRWPTRGDVTDWSSYGSGFLFTHDDQGTHRAACVWGEEAFLFTSTSIYRLVAIGQSASNPIGFEKFPVKNYDAPISNVVQGRRGLYFWSVRGPVLFNGQDVIPLYDTLEKDPYYYDLDLNTDGVFVWADPYSQSIRFYNKRQWANPLRYIFWEKAGGFTTLNSSAMYLAGLGEYFKTEYWGIDAQDITVAPIPITRRMDEFTGTVTEGGAAWDSGTVVIRGITFPEGAFVNKVVRSVRISGLFGQATSGNNVFAVGCQLDNTNPSIDWTVAVTASGNLQTFSFQIDSQVEAPVWCLRIDVPIRAEIHEIYIDYEVAGDIQHNADVTP